MPRDGWYTDHEMEEAEAKGFNQGNGAAQEYAETKSRAATLAIITELKKIKGSFKVIELKRSDEYKEAYNQIVNLIISLRQQQERERG